MTAKQDANDHEFTEGETVEPEAPQTDPSLAGVKAPAAPVIDQYFPGDRYFYHPGRGYWEAIGGVFQSILDSHPAGTIDVPKRPDHLHDWDNKQKLWVPTDGWSEALRSNNQALIDRAHEVFLEKATGSATMAERDTWRAKEAAARAYDAGSATAAQTAMLEAEATGDGSDVASLVARIIGRADAFMLLAGNAAGIRQGASNALAAAIDAGDDKLTTQAAIEVVMANMDQQFSAALDALSG